MQSSLTNVIENQDCQSSFSIPLCDYFARKWRFRIVKPVLHEVVWLSRAGGRALAAATSMWWALGCLANVVGQVNKELHLYLGTFSASQEASLSSQGFLPDILRFKSKILLQVAYIFLSAITLLAAFELLALILIICVQVILFKSTFEVLFINDAFMKLID